MGFIKKSKYQGLHLQKYSDLIEDTSFNSPDYFRITQFPKKLTAGKNAFLLAGNSLAFKPNSEIKFECVAVDGSNVYMEVPNWYGVSGNRMLTLWVYPWTPIGNGIITLVAKLRSGRTVRWKRLIQIDPYSPNITPIVFGRKPKAFVQEKRKEFLNQGYAVGNTAETQISTGTVELVTTIANGVTTTHAYAIGFNWTSEHEGGHLIIQNPIYNLPSGFALDATAPDGSSNTPQAYDGYIQQVINSSQAIVNHPYELLNVSETFIAGYFTGGGWFSYQVPIYDTTQHASYLVNTVLPSAFTLDYIQTPTYTTGSGNVESYALVTLANLEPIAGDVERVTTKMRSAGFTEWEKIGDDNLNFKELLIDGNSHELTKKMGFFADEYTVNTYWTSSGVGYDNSFGKPFLSRQSSSMMDSLRISGSEELSDGLVTAADRENAYIRTNCTIPLTFYAGCDYQISFNYAHTTDLYDGFPPEMIVFMSGSSFDNVDANGQITDPTLGKKIVSLGEENTFSTWQEQVAETLTNPNFIPGLGITADETGNWTFDSNNMANNNGGLAASPAFSGQTSTNQQQSGKTFWSVAGANIIPDPQTQTYTFKADRNGTGVPVFQVKAGMWDISKLSIKSVALPGFTPNHTFLLSHIPNEKMNDLLDFKWEFYDGEGNKNNVYLVTHSMHFSGSNTYIEEALLPGVFNIGPDATDVGFSFSGMSSAILRTTNPTYPGFNQATGSGGGGIIIWSGSIGADGKEYAGQPYYGVGMELVGSSSWIRFRTKTGSSAGAGGELDITTDKFFLGSERTSFISGSGDGTIAISSSNFELGTDGNVTMQGTITAEAGGTIGGFTIGTNDLTATNFTIDSSDKRITLGSGDDVIVADADEGLWVGRDGIDVLDPPPFAVNMQGYLTASKGTIGGWTISNTKLESADGRIRFSSTATGDNISIYKVAGDSADSILQYYSSDFLWGIVGRKDSKVEFELGNPLNQGNSIAGWRFDSEKLTGGNLVLNKGGFISSSNNWHISSSTDNNDPVGFISSSAFKVSADGRMTASAGKIAGWKINGDELQSLGYGGNAGIRLDGDTSTPQILVRRDDDNFIKIHYASATDNGFTAHVNGANVFQAGSTNQIGGWSFNHSQISSSNLVLSSSGTIKTIDFQSSEFGTGKGWKISSDGKAEFEEAKIRGTLSTAVFEKDTVSAVGGQLIIANATAVTGSNITGSTTGAIISAGVSCVVPVDNASGFIANEYVMAKATSSNGFTEEIMKVTATSTVKNANTLTLTRGQNNNIIPSMSAGQTLVSLGSSGTGYIHMNASPSNANTPYMDIVERTGSGYNDTNITARVGDLSGITDNDFSDGVTGHGIYTSNGYFKGKIEVASIPSAPFVSDEEIIHYNFAAGTGSTVINQAAPADNWTMYSGSIQGTVLYGSGSDAVTGTSLKLDEGNNCYIQVEDREAWAPGGSAANVFSQSFSVWFKAKNVAHTEPQIIWEVGGNTAAQAAFVSRSMLYYTSYDNSGDQANEQVVVSSSITSSKWYHAAGVYAKGTSSLWLDGRRVDYKENYSKNSYALTYTGRMGVGACYNDVRLVSNNENPYSAPTFDTGQAPYTGSIDELRIYYGKALSENEIKGLFGVPAGAASPASTIIEGGRIKTGQIQSKNYGTDAGGEIDLDAGTITFGGSATSSFKVTADGLVSATNFSEKYTIITSGNKAQYYENYSDGGNRTRIICDGSLGGDVTLNLQIDVAPDYQIGDIKLPSQGTGIVTHCQLLVNVAGVTLDDGDIAGAPNLMGRN
tara:strand:- start:16723 stop:22044 length:5322 start_codon:yes stop_codon:yes gene_type:complete